MLLSGHKSLRRVAFVTCVWAIWYFRNRCVFDGLVFSVNSVLSLILALVKEAGEYRLHEEFDG